MPTAITSKPRFLALDVFRGMTIVLMIIVNNPGDDDLTFAPLHHAHWNGFTPTDLVFPSFMFAVGNAMSFVMKKWDLLPTSQVLGKIFKRTFIIFLLGYLMYWFPFVQLTDSGHLASPLALSPIANTRIFGVLQRIALGYCFASLMIYFLKPYTTFLICIGILLAYWGVMMYFGDASDPFGMLTNAGTKLDLWVMGPNHLYHGEGVAFDPEGILSTFPAIGNVVGGYMVGRYVQEKGKTYEGLTKLLLAGFGLVLIAFFWNYQFPINKKLWTSSFVLHTVGLDCMLLAAIIYFIDFAGKTKWTRFFEIVGKNPLPIYLLSELLPVAFYAIHIGDQTLFDWLYQNIFSLGGPYIGSLMYAVFYMLLCWSFGYLLDKKKIYIRV